MGVFGKKKPPAEILAEGKALYERGDYGQAVILFLKVGRKENGEGDYWAGRSYLARFDQSGRDGELKAAKRHLSLAAEAGHTGAVDLLAQRFGMGDKSAPPPAPPSPAPAPAPQQPKLENLPLGELEMQAARAYNAGDYAKALTLYELAAQRGSTRGQVNCHKMYSKGLATPVDLPKALMWLEKAAEAGHIEAQFNCGVIYNNGAGTAVDKARAIMWHEKAAEQGHTMAQFYCASMYDSGAGTAVDKAKALMWYEKAAQRGLADAQFRCGRMYDRGIGTAPDKAKARAWYEKAAAQNHEDAKAALQAHDIAANAPSAEMTSEERYTKGMALFQAGDYDGAFPLLKRACSLIGSRKDKYPDGQAAMGWMYENGQGTETKGSMAYTHYKIAARNGNKDGMAGMVRLTAKKDVPSIDECQRALDYIKQLGTEEAKSLLSTVEQKLTEVQKREELKELDLTYENVNAIFDQCGKVNEDGSTTWDEEKLASNKMIVLYLMGQLALVREGVTEHELDASFFKRYDGKEWAGSMATVIHLLNMGGKNYLCSFYKKDDKQFVQLRITGIKPTLSPLDPTFLTWWESVEGVVMRARSADGSGKSAEAMSLWRKAAELGDMDAQYWVGRMYQYGNGVEVDYVQAIHWYQKAAEQGHDDAKYAAKRCQIFIDALHGDAAAQCIYALELERSDPQKALDFMEKSAEQGHDDAQYRLGLWYAFGRNAAKNSKESLRLFQLAAKQGHTEATELLALMKKTWNRYVDLEVEMLRIMDTYDSISNEERGIPTKFWEFLPTDFQSKFAGLLAERLRKKAESL